jgi:hypothetical protein
MGRDYERGPVFALLVASYGVEVDEPHFARPDGLAWRLLAHRLGVHPSATGASASASSSASAR